MIEDHGAKWLPLGGIPESKKQYARLIAAESSPEAEAKQLLEFMDADHDGKISKSEFFASIEGVFRTGTLDRSMRILFLGTCGTAKTRLLQDLFGWTINANVTTLGDGLGGLSATTRGRTVTLTLDDTVGIPETMLGEDGLDYEFLEQSDAVVIVYEDSIAESVQGVSEHARTVKGLRERARELDGKIFATHVALVRHNPESKGDIAPKEVVTDDENLGWQCFSTTGFSGKQLKPVLAHLVGT